MMQIVKACCLIAVTLCFCAFLLEARKDLSDVRTRIDALQIDAHKSLTKIATAARNIDLSQQQQSRLLVAEQDHLRKVTLPMADKALLQSAQTFSQLGTLVSNTDASLNRRPDGVLPTLQGLVISADNGVQMYTTSTQPVIDETAQAMHKFEQAMTAVSEIADDESWQHIPQNLDALTTSAMEASGNINATTVDVRQAVHDYIHPRWPMKLLDGLKDVSNALPTAFKLVF